jgi:hypothetical protein
VVKMKKIIIAMAAILLLITARQAYADEEVVYIPDPHFKNFLVNFPDWGDPAINTNHDGEIQVSEAKAYYGTLEIGSHLITDLTGIQELTGVYELELTLHSVSHIDLSGMDGLRLVNFDYVIADSVSHANCTNLNEIRTRVLNCEAINLTGCVSLQYCIIKSKEKKLQKITGLQTCTNIERLGVVNSRIGTIELETLEKILSISVRNNELKRIILADKKTLVDFVSNEEKLTELNIQNGKNTDMNYLDISNCPNLYCIQVDNPEYSEVNWRNSGSGNFKFDEHIVFSEDCISSVREDTQDEISIFPNPAREFIEITRTGFEYEDILIYDISGKLQMNWWFEQGQTTLRLNTSELPAGNYFALINQQTFKFIKE